MDPRDFKRSLLESNWFNSLKPRASHPGAAPGEPRDDSDYCMACNGSGEVIVLRQDGIDPQDAYESAMTCPECDGTGATEGGDGR